MKKPVVYGVIQLVLGLLLFALGIFTFFHTESTLPTFIFVYGIVSIISGVAEIIIFIMTTTRSDTTPAGVLVMGILNILMGILLVSNVWAGLVAFSFLFPLWLIFMCIARLAGVDAVRRYVGNWAYWMSIIINVLGILAGFFLMFFPLISSVVMTYMISVYLILAAVEMIVFAVYSFRYAKQEPSSETYM